MNVVFALSVLVSCRRDPPRPGASATLHGLSGAEGVLLWGPEEGGWSLESSPDATSWQVEDTGGGPWWIEAPAADAWFRLVRGGAATEPMQPLVVSAVLTLEEDLLLPGEPVAGSLQVSGGDGGAAETDDGASLLALSVQLSRTQLGAAEEWMDGACLDEGREARDCWSETPAALSAWQLPALESEETSPGQATLRAALLGEASGLSVVLDTSEASYVGLGRRLAFGDLHAHTNLSHDGCETLDETCSSRSKHAAADFFDIALDEALDFAALTDHSEFVSFEPPDGAGEETDIWLAQQDAVIEADGSGTVPLIGYEWTAAVGHRTVLFEEMAPCPLQRVPGWMLLIDRDRVEGGDRFYASSSDPVAEPSRLWAALEEGGAACGSTGRVLTIPHHPAVDLPSPVIWADPLNTPDLHYERLVEIASEHGVSECVNLSVPECDWRLKVNIDYVPGGSVQAALLLGYPLGFVGGTDSHDSRPGSLSDGPSCIATILSDGTYQCHDYPGALTGVYYGGELDRESLFDGLYRRNTLATTGPRPDLRVALVDPDGAVFLPGDDVPADEPRSYLLALDLSGASGDLIDAELIGADGVTVEAWSEASARVALEAAPGDVRYLRLRLDVGGTEERIWLSPFFFGP